MKQFTLSILFSLFTLCLYAQFVETDWIALNLNEPTGKYVRSTSVVNENIIWGLIMESNDPFGIGNQFFRTLDGGQTFEVDTLPYDIDDIHNISFQALDENTAYTVAISINEPFEKGMYKTANGGQSWELIYDAEALQISPLFFHFFNNSDGVFLGVQMEGSTIVLAAFYTQDGGESWVSSSGTINTIGFFNTGGNAIMENVGDTIWIAGEVILRSTDKGQSWEEFDTGIQNYVFSDIAFKDALNGLAVSPFDQNNNSVSTLIQTNDGGATWTEVDFPLSNGVIQLYTIEYIPGTEGSYIVSNGDLQIAPDQVFFAFTNDDGATWEIGVAPQKLYCTDFISSTVGFGGSDISTGGLLKFDDNIFENLTSLELLYDDELEIFPNPTQNLFKIQLNNKLQGELTIKIINNLGQVIMQRHEVNSSDYSTIEMDISNLPAGQYRVAISNTAYMVIKTIVKI